MNRTNGKERPATNGHALVNSVNPYTKRLTDIFDYKRKGRKGKCPQCRAENVWLSKYGLCFCCEQKAEFVYREKLSPVERLRLFKSSIGEVAI